MLKVGTIIKKSNIQNAGLGLFTTEDIKKGQVIYEVDDSPVVINNFLFQTLPIPEALKNKINIFSEVHDGNRYIVFDSSTHINHSVENANMVNTGGYFSDMVATRDISAGEELYVNYYLVDDDAVNKLGGMDVK